MPYSLLQHNTFGIDASCRQFVEYASVAQLKEVVATLGDTPWLHIGAGSNLLFVQGCAAQQDHGEGNLGRNE